VDTLLIILFFGSAMAVIALIGGVTLFFSETVLERLLLPMVALASGSLIGGAFFHLLPYAAREGVDTEAIFLWLAADLIPEFWQGNAGKANLVHTFCWLAGISILLSVSFL